MDVHSPAVASTPDNGSAISQPRAFGPSIVSIFEQLRSYPFDSDPEFQDGLSTILGHPSAPMTEEEESQLQGLIIQAKCFYFSRKQNLQSPIDAFQYAAWLDNRQAATADLAFEQSPPLTNGTTPPPPPAATSSTTDLPPSQSQIQTQTRPPPSEPLLPSSQTSTLDPFPSSSSEPPTTAGPSTSNTSTTEAPAQAPYPSSFEHIVELITTGQPIPGIETIPDTVLAGQEQPSVKARRKKPWEKEPDDLDPESSGVGDGGLQKQDDGHEVLGPAIASMDTDESGGIPA